MRYKIMGAGPAGLSAAIEFARTGYSVNVFEETTMVGGHIGNNIQAIRNYGSDRRILERFEKEGLKLKKFNPIFSIVKYSPKHNYDRLFSNNEPIFYTIKRGVDHDSLENQLADQARDLGAEILLGKKARIVDVNIVAGGSKFDPIGMGYGGLFENSDFDSQTILFFFGNKYAPHGYAYVVPYNKKQLTIAIISFVKADFPTLERRFNDFIKGDPIVKKLLQGAKLMNRFSGYGHYNLPDSAIYRHKYFVGGAAGFVDPARGFGMKYAILSGILAARAITSKANYDDLWQKEFRDELVTGFNRRTLLNKLALEDYETFVHNRKIPIEEYEKVPASVKHVLMHLNGSLKLAQWKKQFNFEEVFVL